MQANGEKPLLELPVDPKFEKWLEGKWNRKQLEAFVVKGENMNEAMDRAQEAAKKWQQANPLYVGTELPPEQRIWFTAKNMEESVTTAMLATTTVMAETEQGEKPSTHSS